MDTSFLNQTGATLLESLTALVVSSLVILSISQLSILSVQLEHRRNIDRAVSWAVLGRLIPQLQIDNCCEQTCLDVLIKQLDLQPELSLAIECRNAKLDISWISSTGDLWRYEYAL